MLSMSKSDNAVNSPIITVKEDIEQMKIRIHRGTEEIGGTCIEVESDGRRIVLDLGLPLDARDDENEKLLPGERERPAWTCFRMVCSLSRLEP